MISDKHSQAARVNGAKSHGPKTPEGKRRSSQNATDHGLLSEIVVLNGESSEGFNKTVDDYLEHFLPVTEFEHNLVEEMAASYWRMRRTWCIEHRLMTDAMERQPAQDVPGQMAAAFSELADGPRLALLHRYEARLHMMYQRAVKTLIITRTAQLAGPDLINEPASNSEDVTSEPTADRLEAVSVAVDSAPTTISSTPEAPSPALPRTQHAELPNEPKPPATQHAELPNEPKPPATQHAELPNEPKHPHPRPFPDAVE